MQCLQCILHLTAPSAAQRGVAAQGLLEWGLLEASLSTYDAARALTPASTLLQKLLHALLDTWVQLLQLLAQMPGQGLLHAPEAANLATVAVSIIKEAAVLAWQPATPDAKAAAVAECKTAVMNAAALLRSLLQAHTTDLLLPTSAWPLLAAAIAPLLQENPQGLGRCDGLGFRPFMSVQSVCYALPPA